MHVTFGDDVQPGRRLGNCSDNCSCVVLTSGVPAGRLRCSTFRHLTAREGGNAKGLLGTILALSVARTRGAFVVADVHGCTSVASARCAGATKVTKTILPRGLRLDRRGEQLPSAPWRRSLAPVHKTIARRSAYGQEQPLRLRAEPAGDRRETSRY